MKWHRLARISGFALAGLTALGLALNTSALPVVLDLRPSLLILSGVAIPLLLADWRSRASARSRPVVLSGTLLASAGQ